MTRRSGAAKALVEQSGRACRGHRLRRAPGVIPVFPNAQQEVRPSASSCQHPDGSVFRIAQLYTVTDLQGITCPWAQWHNTSRFMLPIARAGPLKPGTALAAVMALAGLPRMTRCTNSGLWPGRQL
jgi:hypothetical protein